MTKKPNTKARRNIKFTTEQGNKKSDILEEESHEAIKNLITNMPKEKYIKYCKGFCYRKREEKS